MIFTFNKILQFSLTDSTETHFSLLSFSDSENAFEVKIQDIWESRIIVSDFKLISRFDLHISI